MGGYCSLGLFGKEKENCGRCWASIQLLKRFLFLSGAPGDNRSRPHDVLTSIRCHSLITSLLSHWPISIGFIAATELQVGGCACSRQNSKASSWRNRLHEVASICNMRPSASCRNPSPYGGFVTSDSITGSSSWTGILFSIHQSVNETDSDESARLLFRNRTGGTNCIRCFELTLRSLNVVQIHTEGLDKCYTTVEAATATCPTNESIATGKSREIMLYSKSSSLSRFLLRIDSSPYPRPFAETKELSGDPVVAQEYCPVNGRFVFTYSVNDGLADNVSENVNECHEPVSELSNCPYGFGLGLRFKRCSFGELGNRPVISSFIESEMWRPPLFSFLEINFQCLGDWIGHNGERYMALLDVQDSTALASGVANGAERRPRYRCAVCLPRCLFFFLFLLNSLDRSDMFEFPSWPETVAEMRRRNFFLFPTCNFQHTRRWHNKKVDPFAFG